MITPKVQKLKRPKWIRGKVSWDENFSEVQSLLKGLKLKSVCTEGACPNRGECWQRKHVTFMILGDVCTRGCLFCNVAGGAPDKPDPEEPEKLSLAVKKLNSKYIVITSVTRDDLPDKGAGHFERAVDEIKKNSPEALIELLIPDFGGEHALIEKAAYSGAKVIGHNIEVPEALYKKVRPRADYRRSLGVLKTLSALKGSGAGILVKSSMILGLGEKEEDIIITLKDLKNAGSDIVYMGQYLSPSKKHWPVMKYYSPEEFTLLKEKAKRIGFKAACASPMVRSSYQAQEAYLSCLDKACV